MLQTVKVRLRKATRIYTFVARDIPLSPGDMCIVRSDRGLECGTVVLPPQDCSEEEAAQHPMSVVRKNTFTDDNNVRQMMVDEEKAFALCMGKIVQRNLPMRLVHVEYTLDRHKVVFYFTADERVDFRELVRDLAHELKTRIELRHIQVRDKSKLVGGLAACGRELCCGTWLHDFMPISMKMAKRQNLSLNPTKISGQCGRLMCCLGYEDGNYPDRKKRQAAGHCCGSEEVPAEWVEDLEEEAAVLVEADELIPDEEPVEVSPGETVFEIDPESGEESEHELTLQSDAANSNGEGAKRGRGRRRARRRRKHNRGGEGEGGQIASS
jgi:cell fate regulator YaaT (PSP1 superfamily)